MAIQLQLRKGTKIENDSFIGAEAELTYDTTTKGLRVHDGTTLGGNLIDTVIEYQEPTAENNYTWYRKYSSGWVEQGGRTTNFTNTAASSSGSKNVTLPVTMANTDYHIIGTLCAEDSNVSGFGNRVICLHSKTTTGFTLDEWNNNVSSSTSCYGSWQVSGKAA